MTVSMAIHEIKDHLSSVIAQLTETGEEVEITKHGRVVAILVPPRASGIVLGVGARSDTDTPSVGDLRWSAEDLHGMFGDHNFPA